MPRKLVYGPASTFSCNNETIEDTKYYKALLIDYPSKEDIKRFEYEKRQKMLPISAQIGNSIEIHGEGGKGVDWTDGCIALQNSDMDILFDQSKKGMQITIVGSINPIEEVLK